MHLQWTYCKNCIILNEKGYLRAKRYCQNRVNIVAHGHTEHFNSKEKT